MLHWVLNTPLERRDQLSRNKTHILQGIINIRLELKRTK